MTRHDLPALRSLELEQDRISFLNLSRLTDLKHLSLSNNDLSGAFHNVDFWDSLTFSFEIQKEILLPENSSLETIDLSFNFFSSLEIKNARNGFLNIFLFGNLTTEPLKTRPVCLKYNVAPQ